MKTNQMHHLSSIYFVNQLLHVSGMFTAHHQEVLTVYMQRLVHVKRLSRQAASRVRMEQFLSDPASSQTEHLTFCHTNF
jgi:hypothetical protein